MMIEWVIIILAIVFVGFPMLFDQGHGKGSYMESVRVGVMLSAAMIVIALIAGLIIASFLHIAFDAPSLYEIYLSKTES